MHVYVCMYLICINIHTYIYIYIYIYVRGEASGDLVKILLKTKAALDESSLAQPSLA